MISAVNIKAHPIIFDNVKASPNTSQPQTTEVIGSNKQNNDAVLLPKYCIPFCRSTTARKLDMMASTINNPYASHGITKWIG